MEIGKKRKLENWILEKMIFAENGNWRTFKLEKQKSGKMEIRKKEIGKLDIRKNDICGKWELEKI